MRLRLTKRLWATPSVMHLTFETDSPLSHQAGQYYRLKLGDLARDYSAASIATAGNPDRVEFLVTKVALGPFSSALETLSVNEPLDAEGPFGFFADDGASGDRLYVATGTGYAPIRAFLQQRKATTPRGRIRILFGCRNQEEQLTSIDVGSLYETEELTVTLSRANPGWLGPTGYVQNHLAESLAALTDPSVYICGRGAMVKGVRHALKTDFSLGRGRVFSERFD